jgi:hypothetical protein
MRRNKLLLLGYDLQRPFSHWIGFNIFSQQEIEKERKKKNQKYFSFSIYKAQVQNLRLWVKKQHFLSLLKVETCNLLCGIRKN